MTEASDIPPMSGDNLPLKEMKAQPQPKPVKPETKKNNGLYVLFILLCLLMFLAGIGTGIYFKMQKKTAPVASPSPSPTHIQEASPSAQPGLDLTKRLEDFEQRLNEADLQEEDLLPPQLDFKLRFSLPQ